MGGALRERGWGGGGWGSARLGLGLLGLFFGARAFGEGFGHEGEGVGQLGEEAGLGFGDGVDIEDELPGVVLGLDARVLEGAELFFELSAEGILARGGLFGALDEAEDAGGGVAVDLEAAGGLLGSGEALGELGEASMGLRRRLRSAAARVLGEDLEAEARDLGRAGAAG